MGVELPRLVPGIERPRTLWIAHRVELIDQAVMRLREAGFDTAGIAPGHTPDPWAQVQVGSIDTLLERGIRPAAELVVFDEAHHSAAVTYRKVPDDYANAYHAGLTATPQRRDGVTLDDLYDDLVVATQYSDLLKLWKATDGREGIVPCRVARPDTYLGSDLAQEPLPEWKAKADNALTFAFAPNVAKAKQWASEFTAAGIPSFALDGKTPDDERRDAIERFRAGKIRVLWNVYVLTEGVDVPECGCVLLARGCTHPGPFLQMVGRGLRPFPSKRYMTLLDLCGATHLHGFPTQDREYGLDGRPIRVIGETLKNCKRCGACVPSAMPVCPVCAYVWPQQRRKTNVRIWDLELQWAVQEAGGDVTAVSEEARYREWLRLVEQVRTREKWTITIAVKEYAKLFTVKPPPIWISGVDVEVKQKEFDRLSRIARAKGYKTRWVQSVFKGLFGHYYGRPA